LLIPRVRYGADGADQPFVVRLSGGSNCHAWDLTLPSDHSPGSSGPVKPRPPYAAKYSHNKMRPIGRICIKVVMGATKLGSIFNAANDDVQQPLSTRPDAQRGVG